MVQPYVLYGRDQNQIRLDFLWRYGMILICTSFLFLRPVFCALRKGRRAATSLFTSLTFSSVLHHASLHPWIPYLRTIDKFLAHAVAVWGFITVIREKKKPCPVTLACGAWPPFAYYFVEPRIPCPWGQDLVHATIHLTSSEGFFRIIR